MIQVTGIWKDGSGNIGTFLTMDEAITASEEKGCIRAFFQEGNLYSVFQVKKGIVVAQQCVVYTKQRELQPLFDSIHEVIRKLRFAESNVMKKIDQLRKLMDLDAENTSAPISMSFILSHGITFTHHIQFKNDEDAMKRYKEHLETKLQKAQYLIGQLDDWVHDMLQQTGYQGCLADL